MSEEVHKSYRAVWHQSVPNLLFNIHLWLPNHTTHELGTDTTHTLYYRCAIVYSVSRMWTQIGSILYTAHLIICLVSLYLYITSVTVEPGTPHCWHPDYSILNLCVYLFGCVDKSLLHIGCCLCWGLHKYLSMFLCKCQSLQQYKQQEGCTWDTNIWTPSSLTTSYRLSQHKVNLTYVPHLLSLSLFASKSLWENKLLQCGIE